jgi:EpsI family protein
VEGDFIITSAGTFEIAEGCSGLHFVLAAAALSLAAIEMNSVRGFARGATLVLLGLTAAVIGNWLRIFVIVLVGYASRMESSLVTEHLTLGWVVFALVVLPTILWYARAKGDPSPKPARGGRSVDGLRVNGSAIGALLLASLAVPAGARLHDATRYDDFRLVAALPAAVTGWYGPAEQPCPWSPEFDGAAARLSGAYESAAGQLVFACAIGYLEQRQRRELIGGRESRPEGQWQRASAGATAVPGVGRVAASTATAPNGTRWAMWHWYAIGGVHVHTRRAAKLQELKSIASPAAASVTILASPCGQDCAGAFATLEEYLRAHLGIAAAFRIEPYRPAESAADLESR